MEITKWKIGQIRIVGSDKVRPRWLIVKITIREMQIKIVMIYNFTQLPHWQNDKVQQHQVLVMIRSSRGFYDTQECKLEHLGRVILHICS